MSKKVKDVMSRSLSKVPPSLTLLQAKQLMDDKGVRHILIVDKQDMLVGIVSDRDVKKFMSPFAGSNLESPRDKATLNMTVEQIHHGRAVFTVGLEDTIKLCIEKILEKNISALPVVDENRLVGLVTTSDLLRYMLNLI